MNQINETKNIKMNENDKTNEKKTKTPRKPRVPKTSDEQILDAMRQKMNIVTEEELIAKNFACTFNKNTHKLSTIKSTKKELDKKAIQNEVATKIQQQLLEKCHIKINYTESFALRSCILVNELPKPSRKKNKKKDKQSNIVEQTLQQSATEQAA